MLDIETLVYDVKDTPFKYYVFPTHSVTPDEIINTLNRSMHML